jgi:signal transduction histidine kinase/ActR/RegA family two-component response regulator
MVEISLTISPVRDSKGKIIGASKIIRDITEQKLAERKLEQAHREAVAASRAKDEFLAALSHELRTPLNPVLLLASEAAENPDLPAEVRAQFTTVRNNVELEARLIDDLLDITRITHGKLSLNLDSVEVSVVLKEAIETVRADLDQKQIRLMEHLRAKRTGLRGDAVRLQQVFWNVLKNAVKFTPPGGVITVDTHIHQGKLVVAITDTGIGMTDSELVQIFEAFTQGDHVVAGGSHRFGGLGLGLAISRKLVELHAGTIKASSQGRGQGSTFTITLPLAPVNEQPKHNGIDDSASQPKTAGNQNKTLHILLVEDHEATRTALALLLKRRSYQAKTAGSLAEARELAANERFQVLISDIGLPDGNGFELMRELKASNEDLQGIALTGYGMEEDITKGQSVGFKVHLTKPVRVQSLEAALATITAGLDKS